MLGNYQCSVLRLEVDAPATVLKQTLLHSDHLQRWLWPQVLSAGLPDQMQPGLEFTTWLGPIAIQHHVDTVTTHSVRLVLSRGIDGFHEWSWGEGWVQSRLEGVSLLPLNFSQTFTLWRLREHLKHAVNPAN